MTLPVLLASTLLSMAQPVQQTQIIKDAEKQTLVMLDSIRSVMAKKNDVVAPRTIEHGNLKAISSRDWTSGFFAGQLWFLYALTRNESWKNEAATFTRMLEREKTNAGTHDMGFKIYCSYGNAYTYTQDEAYRKVIIEAAKTLSTRFNPKIGCIRSWDHNRDKWQFPVIIDNMMNLELLFAATRFTGDSSFYHIAVTHANTTLNNHFRKNYSTWHVVDYDTVSGMARSKVTHQGYADNSAWARGQAWALYGYTLCYRETKNPRYLQQADSIASFIFKTTQLPADLVPYWDYNDPAIPKAPRDASAAAIAASALFELRHYSRQGEQYKQWASQVIESLTQHYRSAIGENKGFLLLHSTGHMPHNSEIDVPINYADYYYLEALLRSKT